MIFGSLRTFEYNDQLEFLTKTYHTNIFGSHSVTALVLFDMFNTIS